MTLTGKQAHVLANLDRVVPCPYKVHTPGSSSRPRFSLDGWECTPQITSLVVKRHVRHLPNGSVSRMHENAAR